MAGNAYVGLSNGGAPGSRSRQRLLRCLGPAVTGLCSIAAAHTDDPVLALTFDDGPDPRWTPAVLRVLREHQVTATFFMLSGKAEALPALARQVAAEGHDIGLHGPDHTRLTSLSAAASRRAMAAGKQRLEDVVGQPVTLFRPPYGAQGVNEVLAARRLGMRVVIWNAWAEDWRDQEPAEVADRAARACAPGTILLLHDGYEPHSPADVGPVPTLDRRRALELVLEQLDSRGLAATSVSRLLDGRPPVLVPWLQRRST